MLLSVSYLFRLSAFLFPPQVTPLLFPLVSFVSFSLRLPLSVADVVRGWDWSPTSVIYYYIPVFLSSTNKTTVASNIWSWCVGYCWLFYYLCISLCLSAQLYSSPHSASVHPLLPSLSLPLFTPLKLSFTLHLSPHFSLPTTHTCINMHTHLHFNIQFAITIVFFVFFLPSHSPPSTFFLLASISLLLFQFTLTSLHLLGFEALSHSLMPSPPSPRTPFPCINVIIWISFPSALSPISIRTFHKIPMWLPHEVKGPFISTTFEKPYWKWHSCLFSPFKGYNNGDDGGDGQDLSTYSRQPQPRDQSTSCAKRSIFLLQHWCHWN